MQMKITILAKNLYQGSRDLSSRLEPSSLTILLDIKSSYRYEWFFKSDE